ncbi:MAG: type VI secretion system baseplate subunit TssG [Pseudomonadota bacterium]|nr:type VI secretion system baseplate subunit TssG [Pseudomonadota bacterium]
MRTSVIQRLEQEPHRFEFAQAVRILQHYLRETRDIDPQQALGESIKFYSSISLAFPCGEIERLSVDEEQLSFSDEQGIGDAAITYHLCPAMIGLTGPMGALPVVYTQHLSTRVHLNRDVAAAAFLDLFNNRLISLFVQASRLNCLPLQYEIDPEHQYARHIQALSGQDLPDDETVFDPIQQAFVAYGGLIRGRRATAEQIQQVLSGYLDLPVRVEQFIPEWFPIPLAQQSCLGSEHNMCLGESVFCGQRVLQIDGRIQLRFGPVNPVQYDALLPDGEMFRAVHQLLRRWCGLTHAVEMVLILDRQAIETARLDDSQPRRLGQGLFLCTQSAAENNADTLFELPV